MTPQRIFNEQQTSFFSSPWCLCVRSGCRAGIWAPPGSAGCRSQWWARCSSVDPTWISAVLTDSLDTTGAKSRDQCDTHIRMYWHSTVGAETQAICFICFISFSPATTRASPPGTCSMNILMNPFSLMEPRYWTMFLCFKCLWRAISSCSGCEYLHQQTKKGIHSCPENRLDTVIKTWAPLLEDN